MAFEDDFAYHIEQVKIRLPHIRGEESTKQSLVVPLFSILGYDVWNPLEVQPEYGADFDRGAKKGQKEKVDYALKINGEPVIFVECKAADASIDNHEGQLSRYFNATPSVRVGILTNGTRIKVFTDLQQPNVMDEKPWMDFDIRTLKQAELEALKKFRKTEFIADQIVSLAEEMVYYNVLVPFIASQLVEPGDRLVRLVAEEIPSIKRVDKKVVDRLTPILRKAIQAAILDHVARSFNPPQVDLAAASAVTSLPDITINVPSEVAITDTSRDNNIETAATPTELKVYELIVKIIKEQFPDATVLYRSTTSYFGIMQKNTRQWFMRVNVNHPPYWLAFRHIKPDAAKTLLPTFDISKGGKWQGDSKLVIKDIADIMSLRPLIIASYKAESDRLNESAEPT